MNQYHLCRTQNLFPSAVPFFHQSPGFHSSARSPAPLPSPRALLPTSRTLLSSRSNPAHFAQQRNLSLGTLGTRIRLPTLRKRATDAPGDVETQLKLFRELMETGETKEKTELLGRWEELTGLWADESVAPQAEVAAPAVVRPLLASDEGFKLYLRALASLAATSNDPPAYFGKLATAPSKRAALLDATTSSTVPPTSDPITDTTTATSIPLAATTVSPPNTPAAASPARPALSPSALVTALFSGPSGRGKGGGL